MKPIFLLIMIFAIFPVAAQQQQNQPRERNNEIAELSAASGISKENEFTNFATPRKQYLELIGREDRELNEELFLQYVQLLISTGNTKLADQLFNTYYLSSSKEEALKKIKVELFSLFKVSALGPRFIINDLAINTINSEFGALIYGNQLVFTGLENKSNLISEILDFENRSYYNIMSIPLRNTNLPDETANVFSKELNSSLHQSNAIFTKDGKQMYFCRNNSDKGRKQTNHNNVSTMQLFKAELSNNKWTNITALPFNSPDYSVGQAALSPDEKTLYFSSDMPGGQGSFDLYKVNIIDDTYGPPINLGREINTIGRENFPFVSNDNKLYFSSDGHLGFGSLDIFVSDIGDNSYANVLNIGYPVNSSMDDFSFYINSDSKEGYFSSDRPTGKGKDDIYRLREIKVLDIEKISRIDSDSKITEKTIYIEPDKTYPKTDNPILRINTEPIYFDSNLDYIRNDSKKIINRVIDLMTKYPQMRIEIASHCDSRGDIESNKRLSQKRADKVKDYMISQGIAKDRIIAMGYGQSNPLINCKSKINCSEEEHELNRRIDFVIINL